MFRHELLTRIIMMLINVIERYRASRRSAHAIFKFDHNTLGLN